jgi:hypothetical protein
MPNSIIVHAVPVNKDVCGGIKVHYQMSMIEKELGYSSFIVYKEDEVPSIKWFEHSCNEYSLQHFKSYLEKEEKEVFLLIGWEDPSSLYILPAKNKVAYIQGHVFFRENAAYSNAKLWYNSEFVMRTCKYKGEVVRPYLASYFFNTDRDAWSYNKDKYILLVQERKDGRKEWEKVARQLSKEVLEKLDVIIWPNSNEKEFRDALARADIFFTHSFPEGFGLPPLEAMALGALVVGYTGGGGEDFMRDRENCFIAKDGVNCEVAEHITNIVLHNYLFLPSVIANAHETSSFYSKEATLNILRKILKEYENGSETV